MLPLPSVSYSLNVQANFSSWVPFLQMHTASNHSLAIATTKNFMGQKKQKVRKCSKPEADCAAVVNVQSIEHKLLHLLCLPVQEILIKKLAVHYPYPISPKSFSEYSMRYVFLLTSPLGLTSLKLLYHSWGEKSNFSSLGPARGPVCSRSIQYILPTSPTYLNLGPVHNRMLLEEVDVLRWEDCLSCAHDPQSDKVLAWLKKLPLAARCMTLLVHPVASSSRCSSTREPVPAVATFILLHIYTRCAQTGSSLGLFGQGINWCFQTCLWPHHPY